MSNPKLTLALERMGAELEHPVDRRQLATLAGISVRQPERLFSAQLRSTINAQYKRIRLERARTLLGQTALPILEIALICGFRTASHFSRDYRSAYGVSPRNGRSPRTP